MRRLTIAALAALSGLAVAAPGAKSPPAKEPPPNPLLGEWVISAKEFGGRPVKLTTPYNLEFKADGTLVVTMGGKLIENTRYTADAKKDPAELDWHMSDANTEPVLCIYRVENDTLTLCMDPPAKTRPTVFKSPAGSTISLCTLKRVVKKD